MTSHFERLVNWVVIWSMLDMWSVTKFALRFPLLIADKPLSRKCENKPKSYFMTSPRQSEVSTDTLAYTISSGQLQTISLHLKPWLTRFLFLVSSYVFLSLLMQYSYTPKLHVWRLKLFLFYHGFSPLYPLAQFTSLLLIAPCFWRPSFLMSPLCCVNDSLFVCRNWYIDGDVLWRDSHIRLPLTWRSGMNNQIIQIWVNNQAKSD